MWRWFLTVFFWLPGGSLAAEPVAAPSFFEPQTLHYWSGPLDDHQLRPELARQVPAFPFAWEGGAFAAGEVWYEFAVPGSAIPDGLAGVLITRVYLNANVYLNRQLIGSGGSMEPPLAKNAHRPLYFTLPRSAWAASDNRIQIQHKSYPGMGYIQAVVLGADHELEPRYLRRYHLQQTLPKALFVAEMLVMVLVFAIWLVRRTQWGYLWFSLSMLMLGVVTLNHFLINTGVSHKVWATLNNSAIDWWAVFLTLFVFARLGLNPRGCRWLLGGYALLSLGYYISLPLSELPSTLLFHGIGFLILLTTTAYLLYLKIHKQLSVLPYLLLYISLILIAAHDLVLQLGLREDGQFILYFAAPISCLLIGAHIVSEFVAAMRQREQHAQQLQQTVNRVKTELDAQYQALKKAGDERVKMAERDRIYRDLHDDVGAKLLSLYYHAQDSQSSSLAKSALQDLRDIVSHTPQDGEKLGRAVAQWQSECQERANDNGIQLHWRSETIDTETTLDETQYMHLSRMLREAISNALCHAPQLSTIAVSITGQAPQLLFQITNNGVTQPLKTWRHGRGLNNIFIRAGELGGEADITQTGDDEVCIQWRVPLQPS